MYFAFYFCFFCFVSALCTGARRLRAGAPCSTRAADGRGCASASVRRRAEKRAHAVRESVRAPAHGPCCAAEDEDEDEQGGGSAVVQKKKSIGPAGPLGASTVNKDKKKDSDLHFSFESARTAVGALAPCAHACGCGQRAHAFRALRGPGACTCAGHADAHPCAHTGPHNRTRQSGRGIRRRRGHRWSRCTKGCRDERRAC